MISDLALGARIVPGVAIGNVLTADVKVSRDATTPIQSLVSESDTVGDWCAIPVRGIS